MLVGIPKEIKNHEYRVGLTPAGVRELMLNGHQVFIEKDAGKQIGLSNDMYEKVGAEIVPNEKEIYSRSELIIKVKEPQPLECRMLSEGQTLFCYLHLAPDPIQTQLLIESGATCIAYETVTDNNGGLPLLAPMSEVAGRLSIQEGVYHIKSSQGGRGVLIGGVPGVEPARVLVIGGGVVGVNAARIAVGMGAQVTIIDASLARLKEIDDAYGGRIVTLYSTSEAVEQQISMADIVVGAVLIPGATSPKLITHDMLKLMKPNSVLVDVSIDQGGCFETSHATTHQDPTFIVDDVIHYCVANMPGGVSRTSTFALTNAVLPFAVKLANEGYQDTLLADPNFLNGLNVHNGKITCLGVAQSLGYDYVGAERAIS